MRIARILTRLNLGGPARQALASDPLLARRGHTLRLFTGAPQEGEGDLFDEACSSGLDAVRISGLGRDPRPTADLSALRQLRRELDAFQPDVVHTHATKAGLLGRLASRGRSWARVHTFHGHVLEGYFSAPMSRALQWSERRLAKGTTQLLAVSEQTKRDLVRLEVAQAAEIGVVPPGVELSSLLELSAKGGALGASIRGACGCSGDDLLVGVIGRLAEVKRPELALEAFRLASSKQPRLRLAFIGDGPLRHELLSCLSTWGASQRSRVTFLGNQYKMEGVHEACDMILLSSRTEGMPVALIEAAAACSPVVSTPVGGVPELVVDRETGILAEGAQGLALALAELATDDALRIRLGRAARARVRERHSAKALADALERVYAEVASEVACAS